MSAKPQPVLVFDADCPLCIGAIDTLVRARLVPRESTRAYQDFEGDDAAQLWEAGIRNEMAAFVRAPGGSGFAQLKSGGAAFLWALESSWLGPLARIASLPGLRSVVDAVYRTVSYNRRILVPARPAQPGQIACACDPDYRPGLRLTLILFCVAALGALAYLFGAGFGRGTAALAVALLLFGAGGVACLRLRGEARMTWVGHYSVAALAGGLGLLPAVLLAPWLPLSAALWLRRVCVAAALLIGFAVLARRRRSLRALSP